MVYEHGGDIYRNKVRLDFSVNTNPLGMSENVKKAIAENIEQFGIYPDAMCVNLRNAIAEKEQVGVDNVLCSNGAAEMIFAVVRAVMPKKSLLLAPTFSEYERALKSVGSQICYYYLKEENDFELQDDFIDYLDDIDMVFICNPNNPVGKITDKKTGNIYKVTSSRSSSQTVAFIGNKVKTSVTIPTTIKIKGATYKVTEISTNAFALAPYARYSFYENKIVRLFLDMGFGFSTQKAKHQDAVNGFEIGVKPGMAIN